MLVTKSKNLNYSLVEKKIDEEQGEAFTKSEGKENTEAKNLHQSPKKHIGLKQNQKLHGSGTIQTSFKTWKILLLPLHGRGSGNCHLSEKKKPEVKKPYTFETNIFIHHFLSIFLKGFPSSMKILS